MTPEAIDPGARASVSATGRGTRVVDVQRQTTRLLVTALGFVVVTPVAAVVPHHSGAWLPIHLFFVGGLVSAVVGVTQMLAVTWSTAPAPPDRLALLTQRLVIIGVIALAVGRELEVVGLVLAGGAAIGIVIMATIMSLGRIRRAAATDRFHPAIDGYTVAFAWVLVGFAGGLLVALDPNAAWSERLGDAHSTANVFGFVGIVIAATLPYFVATQSRMKMSRGATATRLRMIFAWLSLSVVVVVAGHVGRQPGLSGSGYLAYAIGIGTVLAHLPAVGWRQLRWAGPRLVQLATGVLWWIGGCVALAHGEFGGAVDRSTVFRVIAVGGYAQILVASVAYLGPVVRAGGHERLTAGFAITRSWISLVAGNVAAVAVAFGSEVAAQLALTVWIVDTCIRAVRLVRSA